MSAWLKNYPLFCCLLTLNLALGLAVLFVAFYLMDVSSYPASNASLFRFLQAETESGADNETHLREYEENQSSIYRLLFTLGLLSLIFSLLLLLAGLIMLCMWAGFPKRRQKAQRCQ